MKRIASSGIGIVLLVSWLGLPAGAQNQGSNQASSNQASSSSQTSSSSSAAGSSLGDYARQIRKAPAAEKPKVFDNDNLPTKDKLSIVGAAPETPAAGNSTDAAAATAPAAGETKAPPETAQPAPLGTNPARSPEEEEAAKQALWKQWSERISAQKDQIDLLARELDVLQREYKIRAAAMYADVGNRMRNSADWDKQDAQYKQQIADKQKALDDGKQKLDDMLEEARKAGVPSSIAEP
jgi:hypothetical protein